MTINQITSIDDLESFIAQKAKSVKAALKKITKNLTHNK